MPSLAAAPVGPPITQLVSLRARTMCFRSAFASVAKPSKWASGGGFCSLLQFSERNLQLRPAGKDNAAFDEVFELAHVLQEYTPTRSHSRYVTLSILPWFKVPIANPY